MNAEKSSFESDEVAAPAAATEAGHRPAAAGDSAAQRETGSRDESLALFLRFSAVGTIGFLVDVAVLYLALGVGFGRYSGRVVSYVFASTSTWALNRRFTFHARKSKQWFREWARFFVANAAGGASNYLVYATLVATSPFVDRYKVIGVAAGSIVGLAINFNLSRFVVFRAS